MPTQTLSFYGRGVTNASAATIGNSATINIDGQGSSFGQAWLKSLPISFGNDGIGATTTALTMLGLGQTFQTVPPDASAQVLGRASFGATLDLTGRIKLQFNPAQIAFGSTFQAQMTDLDLDGFEDGKMNFTAFLDLAPKNVLEWIRSGERLWTPDWLGGELLLWLDARDFNSRADGSTITAWPTRAVQYPYSPVSGTSPTVLSSKNAVKFVATSSQYMNTAISSSVLDRTIIAVVNIDDTVNPVGIIGSTGQGLGFRVNASDKLQWVRMGVADLSTSVASVPQDVDVLLSGTMLGSNWNQAINGTLQSGSHGQSLTAGLTSRLGLTYTGEYFDGQIKLILVSTARSLAEQQQMEGWAAWEFGLQGSLDASHPYKYAPPTVRSFE